jgi:hypothetical protein
MPPKIGLSSLLKWAFQVSLVGLTGHLRGAAEDNSKRAFQAA